MPWGLKRYQETGQSHFITFSCYRRRQLLREAAAKAVFEKALERVRRDYAMIVYAYVVMPEHVHLLVSEPGKALLADAIKSLKQGVSRRLIGEAEQFWQRRYFDLNIRCYPQFQEKLGYIHHNPVKRGLRARTRLAMEQRAPLSDGRRRHRRDRVDVDGKTAGADDGNARAQRTNHPTQAQQRGLNGAPQSLLQE